MEHASRKQEASSNLPTSRGGTTVEVTASMPGRVVVQWDKDDCEDLGIIKVDLLGLGMMAALEDTVNLCKARGPARAIELHRIPSNDPTTYDMIRRADTVGVFQIESRAQMATLPRIRPACFYDLVISVAIIRPGPIVGQMVHPYLDRRAGREQPDCMDPRLDPVLKRTVGCLRSKNRFWKSPWSLLGSAARRPRNYAGRSATIVLMSAWRRS